MITNQNYLCNIEVFVGVIKRVSQYKEELNKQSGNQLCNFQISEDTLNLMGNHEIKDSKYE